MAIDRTTCVFKANIMPDHLMNKLNTVSPDETLSQALNTICVNHSGGFFQHQVQLALQGALTTCTNIFVPKIEMIAGQGAMLSLSALHEEGFTHIAFSFQSTAHHQIAIWVTLGKETQAVSIYDSLGNQPLTSAAEARLLYLLGLQDSDSLVYHSPRFGQQTDDWSCGVHVFATLAALANCFSASTMDVRAMALTLLICYQEQELGYSQAAAKEQLNIQQNMALLTRIEHFRTQQEHRGIGQNCLSSLANFLQKICWGNTDSGLNPEEQSGRSMDALPTLCSLSFSELLEIYPSSSGAVGKLVLQLADCCPDIQAFNWPVLFTLIQQGTSLQVSSSVERKVGTTIKQAAGSYSESKDKTWLLILLIINNIDDTMQTALKQVVQTIFAEDAALYDAYITENQGYAEAVAVCYSLLTWLTEHAKTLDESTIIKDKLSLAARQSETLALTQSIDARLKKLSIDDESRQQLLTSTTLTKSIQQAIFFIPQKQFEAVSPSDQIAFLQILFNGASMQEMISLPLRNNISLCPLIITWLEQLNKNGKYTRWTFLRYQDALVTFHDKSLDLEIVAEICSGTILSSDVSFSLCAQTILEGTLSYNDLRSLTKKQIEKILSACILQALRDKLFTLADFKQLDPQVTYRFNPTVISALKDNLFHFQDILALPGKHAHHFLTNDAIAAMRKGYYTLKTLQQLSEVHLNSLTTVDGISVLCRGSLTLSSNMPAYLYDYLLNQKIVFNLTCSRVTQAEILSAIQNGHLPQEFPSEMITIQSYDLITSHVLGAINKGLLNFNQLVTLLQDKKFNVLLKKEVIDNLIANQGLSADDFINAIDKNYITNSLLDKRWACKVKMMLSFQGLRAFCKGLITAQQIDRLDKKLREEKNSLSTLEEMKLSAISMTTILSFLFTEQGINFLTHHPDFLDSLCNLRKKLFFNFFDCMNAGRFSWTDLDTLPAEKMTILYEALKHLKLKLYSVVDFHQLPQDKLRFMVQNTTLLSDQKLTMQEIYDSPLNELKNKVLLTCENTRYAPAYCSSSSSRVKPYLFSGSRLSKFEHRTHSTQYGRFFSDDSSRHTDATSSLYNRLHEFTCVSESMAPIAPSLVSSIEIPLLYNSNEMPDDIESVGINLD